MDRDSERQSITLRETEITTLRETDRILESNTELDLEKEGD